MQALIRVKRCEVPGTQVADDRSGHGVRRGYRPGDFLMRGRGGIAQLSRPRTLQFECADQKINCIHAMREGAKVAGNGSIVLHNSVFRVSARDPGAPGSRHAGLLSGLLKTRTRAGFWRLRPIWARLRARIATTSLGVLKIYR